MALRSSEPSGISDSATPTHPTTHISCRTGTSRSRMPTTAACSSSSPAHRIVRQYGTSSLVPPTTRHARLGAINAATPLPDGGIPCQRDQRGHGWTTSQPVVIFAGQSRPPVSYPSDPQLLAAESHPAGRRRAARPRDHHDPDRACALALRPVVGAGHARPSIPGNSYRARDDRHQRRLPAPSGDRQRQNPSHRLAVRPHGCRRAWPWLSPHTRRARPAGHRAGPEASPGALYSYAPSLSSPPRSRRRGGQPIGNAEVERYRSRRCSPRGGNVASSEG